jgi:hypothetical protein
MRPGDEVVFAGREVDELDKGMGETLLRTPGCTTPETETLTVKSGDVGSER